ncbi:MAG TPA: hypothetical protein VGP12_02670 [Nitrosospira sp.]|jgi:hypothetical protein|nr:hypothetical protein [Nitrosospira sp.]
MTKGTIAAIVTGIITLAALVVSGVVFLASLILALNGYMGQDTAVNGSFITYIVLALITALASVGLGAWLAFYLTERRKMHAALSAVISIVLMSAVGTGLHFVCVIVAAVVAEALRVKR